MSANPQAALDALRSVPEPPRARYVDNQWDGTVPLPGTVDDSFARWQAEVARLSTHYDPAADCLLKDALGLAGEVGEVVELIKKKRSLSRTAPRRRQAARRGRRRAVVPHRPVRAVWVHPRGRSASERGQAPRSLPQRLRQGRRCAVRPNTIADFWSRVRRGRGCWLWVAETRARGEANGWSKLTSSEVRHIRALADRAALRQADIAARFGVTQGVVSKIKRRALWAHV